MILTKLRLFAQTVGFVAITILALHGAFGVFANARLAFGAPQEAPAQQVGATSKTVPPYLNYQGILRDPEGNPMSGLQKMTFRIYDRVSAPLNEAIFTEEHTDVTVRNGHFSVLLGNNVPLPPTLFFGPDTFIGVTVDPFDEMSPRQRLASVPYAIYADHASSLTRPDGGVDQAVYVDEAGRVGIGTTTPSAQVQITNTTGATATVQIDAGGQQLLLNPDGLDSSTTFHINATTNTSVALAAGGGRVGIGTTTPDTQLHLKGDDPDINLDINTASQAERIEIRFSEDGVERSRIEYAKSTDELAVINKGANTMTFDGQKVGVNTPDPVTTLDVNGDVWVRNTLFLGAQRKPPVKIIRMGPLPEDSTTVIPGVTPNDYECVTSSWSVRMDVDEDDSGPYTVWAFVQGSNWMVRTRFWTDKPESSKVDVLCFLKGIVEYSGNRADGGFN